MNTPREFAMHSPTSRRFTQLDVFTEVPLRGNPLAVVHDADDIPEAHLPAFANWTNLSETAFLLRPTDPAADYRVRIFTPAAELAFAGHPTLGSCAAWLRAGGEPRNPSEIVQQCGVGLVRVRRDGERLAFAAPPARMAATTDEELARVCHALGLAVGQVRASQWTDNGTRWMVLLLDDAATVLGVEPDHAALRTLAKVGLVGPQPADADSQFEVRGFVDPAGIPEDPVTGSLNAMLAQWLMHIGAAPSRYVARQGTRLGRDGRVHVERTGADTWIGGAVAPCIDGQVRL
jgi:PhzF family phenazine biosynthesis protein